MAHQAPEEAIANALFLYCEHWIECKTTDLEDAGLVIIAYLAGAGFHIEHEDDEMERANGETESEKEISETSKAEQN
jgi:hypothetical protein